MEKSDKLYEKISSIESKYYIVFGLSTCPYCIKTLELLRKSNVNYKYYSVDECKKIFFDLLSQISQRYSELKITSNHKTFPVIFHEKKFIGGYTELLKNFT